MIEDLMALFTQHSDADRASKMEAYMKFKFKYFGIPSPKRKSIQSEVFIHYKFTSESELKELILLLWSQNEREFHYAALDLLAKNKKFLQPNSIDFLEFLIVNNSWWDSVDGLASQVIGPYFKKFPDQKNLALMRWKQSDNMWLRRTCIIHQLGYKMETDLDILTEMILLNSESKEFFLQKAIGWSLRQYAKYNSDWVQNFVEINTLKNLSKREALKNII